MTQERNPAVDSLDPSEFTRKVVEALAKDVGRGLARLDPTDMAALGVSPGDVIRVTGKRQTVAKVMAAFPEDRGKGTVQIDGLTRNNAGVALGERPHLQRTVCSPAKKVRLAPTTSLRTVRKEGEDHYVGRLLEGLVLVEGDRIRVTLVGTRSQDLTVLQTQPKGPVAIVPTTIVEISRSGGTDTAPPRIFYEDIGGLGRELSSIREMIELPLRYPEIFERLGIDAPKGVLLYGPPGTGKTMIARAVANETDAKFFSLSGPEIMHKFYGESEAHLRRVFEEASRGPSIIFFDEIDAIAPKRSALGGEQQVERRVVSQLLTLMDGLESRGQVIVIAATNIPDSLDPALRRPGRFDREIVIGVPDKIGRLQILNVHSRGMPLASDVDLERVAQTTHGLSARTCNRFAVKRRWRGCARSFRASTSKATRSPMRRSKILSVQMEDFEEALALVAPSAIREVFTEVPDVRWRDVGGLDTAKRILMESIQWPALHPELFRRADIAPPRGILLYGAPGVGKTLLAKAVATESNVNFISVKGPALMSRWVGETERAVRDIFQKARQAAPCIIFLDEVDSIAPRRGGGEASSVTDRAIAQLLTEMDGIEELKGVIVLAATNRVDIVDPALLRSGRFDFLLELAPPDAEARLAIFRVHTRGKPLAADVDLTTLANTQADGCSGADIELICRKAGLAAIRDFLAEYKEAPVNLEGFEIRMEHFTAAVIEMDGGRTK